MNENCITPVLCTHVHECVSDSQHNNSHYIQKRGQLLISVYIPSFSYDICALKAETNKQITMLIQLIFTKLLSRHKNIPSITINEFEISLLYSFLISFSINQRSFRIFIFYDEQTFIFYQCTLEFLQRMNKYP